MESIAESQRAPFTFIWTIENFSPQTCLNLFSPSFIVQSMGNTKWYIDLEEHDEFGCSLVREGNKDTGPKSIEIDFEIAVLADNGSVLISEKGHDVFKKKPYSFSSYLFELDDPLWEKWRKVSSRDILIIRCRMWKTHGQKRVRSTSADMGFACSKLRVEQNSFIWSVRDFSSLLVRQTKILSWQSPTNEEPKISLDLNLFDYKNKEEVNIYPTLEKSRDCNYAISYSISVLDARGKEVDCLIDRRRMEYPKEHYLCSSIISKSKLIANKDLYLKNDVLLLRCTFKIGKGFILKPFEYSYSTSSGKANKSSISYGRRKTFKDIRDKLFSRIPPAIDLIESKSETFYEEEKDHSTFSCASHSLKKALKGLFEDGVLSDAILRTGDELFSIHINIVSARSPIFRGVFEKKMKEKEIIDVPDLDADTLRNLLLFLYTETVKDLQWQNASDLFKAAHLYRIRDLADVCSSFLRDNLSESNVEDALSICKKFYDYNLKLAAKQFSSIQSK